MSCPPVGFVGGAAALAGADPRRHHPFTISGTTAVPLAPGASAPVELRLSDPNLVGLIIMKLTMWIGDVSASAGSGQCGASSFLVGRFCGSNRFVVGASGTSGPGEPGIVVAHWPLHTTIGLPVS